MTVESVTIFFTSGNKTTITCYRMSKVSSVALPLAGKLELFDEGGNQIGMFNLSNIAGYEINYE